MGCGERVVLEYNDARDEIESSCVQILNQPVYISDLMTLFSLDRTARGTELRCSMRPRSALTSITSAFTPEWAECQRRIAQSS